jgi:ubiquinone/menaquinone biosynthesis C-methylase UbiE
LNDIEKHIIDEFNSDITQKIYIEEAKKGLWKSEEILIKKHFKQNSSILDIGCGTGRTTIALHKTGYNITGIDFSDKMIENAIIIANNLHLKINYVIGNATNLKFSSESFDNALFSFNGLTQIPLQEKRIQALKEICRILKSNGYFIFTINSRRMLSKYFFFWIKQWIKIKILKKMGCKINEFEFGDLFFKDQNRDKQYIHIPNIKEVKKLIRSTNLKLLYYQKANAISPNDNLDESTLFFICQKAMI